MGHKTNTQDKIRKDAEARLARAQPSEAPASALSPEKLLYELQVHQIELEMQIEELRASHIALEESRDRYVDLFEFAPVCYITIGREAMVTEVNLPGCALLGVERAKLINRRLSRFVTQSDKDRWHCLFMNMMTKADFEKQSFDLAMVRADGSIFCAHFDSLRREVVNSHPILHLALTDITELKQAEEKLRELTAHIQTVREEEKIRLAREIHDDLGSTLAALNLKLSHMLDFEFSEDMKKTPLFTRLESMSQILDSAIASTRRIITDMRPDALDSLGLFSALKWQAEQFQKSSGIGCRVICANDRNCVGCKDCEYLLDKTLSINLFRIFQEALSNVVRHSGASNVKVEYRPGNGVVILSICDNGSGLPEGHTPASTSFGIRGMRERVGQLGGLIKFDSALGGGLCVTVRLPLAADNTGATTI